MTYLMNVRTSEPATLGLLQQCAQQVAPQRWVCLNLLQNITKLSRNLESIGVSVSTVQKSLKVIFCSAA